MNKHKNPDNDYAWITKQADNLEVMAKEWQEWSDALHTVVGNEDGATERQVQE